MEQPEPDARPIHFDSYREFLATRLEADRSLTRKALAASVGRSPAWMTQVMRGRCDIHPTMAPAMAAAMGLAGADVRAFGALVDLESEVAAVRRRAASWLDGARAMERATYPASPMECLYSRWHYGAILELARCDGFVADPEWIAAHLRPRVPVAEVASALTDLEALGLLVRDEGTLRPAPAVVATKAEVPRGSLAAAMATWHTDGLLRAAESLRGTPTRDRHHAGLLFALAGPALDELRARLVEFEREAVALAEAPQAAPDRVYQLVFALFPVSERTSISTPSRRGR